MIAAIPYIVAVFAVSAYALLGPIVKKAGIAVPPLAFIATSSLILFVTAGSISFFTERNLIFESFRKAEWHWILAFSLINLVAYVGYLWAISRIPVVHYEMLIILGPIVGGLFALYLLKEPFHLRYVPALIFMLIGLLIAIKPAFLNKLGLK